MKELKAAVERFYRRERAFFTEEGEPKYSPEEHTQRFHSLVEQFDITARKLLKKAEQEIQTQQKRLDARPGLRPKGTELQRAELRLQIAQSLRDAVIEQRAKVANERTENQEPKPGRPVGPPFRP